MTHHARLVRWLVLAMLVPVEIRAADPILGTWKLNVQKSRFLPGPAFKSESRTYAQEDGGIKVTIQTVDGKGNPATIIYLTTPDGQQHSVSGSGGPADVVALKRIDERTAESTLMHAGKEIAKTRRVITEDGKVMTITYQGLDPNGTPVNNTEVFEHVE
jgi:hypothetical protein